MSTPGRPKHMPEDTPDFMAQAWVDCLRWAASDADVLRQFETATGVYMRAARSALDQMIDEATGANRDYFEKFVVWFNEHIWGSMDGQEVVHLGDKGEP